MPASCERSLSLMKAIGKFLSLYNKNSIGTLLERFVCPTGRISAKTLMIRPRYSSGKRIMQQKVFRILNTIILGLIGFMLGSLIGALY